MINFTAASRGLFGRVAIVGAVAAASLAFAAPASATVKLVDAKFQNVGMGGDKDGGGYTGGDFVIMSPFEVNFTADGVDFSALAFCIEMNVPMPIMDPYSGSAETLNMNYYQGSLNDADKARIGQLVNYGTALFGGLNSLSYDDLSLELSAIQGAIWRLTTDADVTFSEAAFDSDQLAAYNPKIQAYAATFDLSGYSTKIHTIYSGKDVTGAPLGQGLAYAGALPVPEPAVWGLMLVGFFGSGSALRLSRRRAQSAV